MHSTTTTDLLAWHTAFDDARSPLGHRLAVVQSQLRQALCARRPGPIRLLSIHAGRGHDVIGVLADHPRAAEIHAVLLEPDGRHCAEMRTVVEHEGLDNVEIVEGNAWGPASRAGAEAADILLAGGLFGSVPHRQLPPVISGLPEACTIGADVIWSRQRRAPDAAPLIQACLANHGFAEVACETTGLFTVGTHRLAGGPPSLEDELATYLRDKRIRALRRREERRAA
ncbi:MAG: SAM-dependent methyltransferase [Solirubrobacteraceae bacterium]